MEPIKSNDEAQNVDQTKRDFMKKFGAYAATAPVGMYMLMTPSASAYAGSCVTGGCNNGWGNGDQCAPGNSYWHNHAENHTGWKFHHKHGTANPNTGYKTHYKKTKSY